MLPDCQISGLRRSVPSFCPCVELLLGSPPPQMSLGMCKGVCESVCVFSLQISIWENKSISKYYKKGMEGALSSFSSSIFFFNE